MWNSSKQLENEILWHSNLQQYQNHQILMLNPTKDMQAFDIDNCKTAKKNQRHLKLCRNTTWL